MVEVKFTIQSLTDLEDICNYISKDSEYYAQMQIQKLVTRTDVLETFPQIGRIVPELKQKSIRELIEGNYRIIYRIVSKQTIHVLTFHHSKRKLKKTLIRKIK